MPFYDFDPGLIQKEKKRISDKQGQSSVFWKPADGRNLVRFLPSCDPNVKEFWKRVLVHFDMRDEEGRFVKFICPRTSDRRKNCPICTHVNGLYKSGSEADREVANKIRPTTRYYYNIYDLNSKSGSDARIWVWEAPMTFHEKKLILQMTEFGNITDVKSGYNMVVQKIQGQNGIPSYELYPKSEKTPIDDAILNLMKQPNITDLSTDRAEKGQGMYDLNVASAEATFEELQEALNRRLAAESKISAPVKAAPAQAKSDPKPSPSSGISDAELKAALPATAKVVEKPPATDYGVGLDEFEKGLKV
jgi:hypothetical protein